LLLLQVRDLSVLHVQRWNLLVLTLLQLVQDLLVLALVTKVMVSRVLRVIPGVSRVGVSKRVGVSRVRWINGVGSHAVQLNESGSGSIINSPAKCQICGGLEMHIVLIFNSKISDIIISEGETFSLVFLDQFQDTCRNGVMAE
jgi:hypothetical protein